MQGYGVLNAKEKLSKLNLYLEQWMLIVLLCLLEN
jgi:hypothetical protein